MTTGSSLASNTEIVGYNYTIHKAEGDHQRVPARVMWQTESYPRDAFKNWETVNDLPSVIGDYVWTGIDYIGESGIGRYWYEGDPEGEHYHRPLCVVKSDGHPGEIIMTVKGKGHKPDAVSSRQSNQN